MTDWEVIEQHVQNMEEALAQLKKYQNIPYEDFKRDLGLIWIVEKGLEILVQHLLDIGAHILSSKLKERLGGLWEIISKLGKHGIFPQSFQSRLRAWPDSGISWSMNI